MFFIVIPCRGKVRFTNEKRPPNIATWRPLNQRLVELGGFEPPSTSLFRAVLHV